jgi:hypothetical protein
MGTWTLRWRGQCGVVWLGMGSESSTGHLFGGRHGGQVLLVLKSSLQHGEAVARAGGRRTSVDPHGRRNYMEVPTS